MIKANKGRVELDGKAYQLLGELGTIVHGIYYIMTEKQAGAPKDVRRMIGKAVKMGLDLENDAVEDVEESDESASAQESDDELLELLEQIRDLLKEDKDAKDYD